MNVTAQTTTGWIIFIAALGMMGGLVAVDIITLKDWNGISTPLFVGTALGHLSSVITAFVGGKLIPEARDISERTRTTDPPKG